jgi:2-aminoethylphosphonate-pyruvate transaminase
VVSLVDMMSSFAGLPLALRATPVDFILSSANKCLQGLPGVSFVLGPRAAIAASEGTARSYALSLARHERSLAHGQFPFTPPVQVLYALAQALRETRSETVAARARRYRECYDVMLAGMTALGFDPLLPRELHSGLLTAFHLPARRGLTFRVANIGALTPDDLRTFVAAVKEFLDGC